MVLLLKYMPMATNENIATERTTEGANPAINPKSDNDSRMITNLMKEPRLVLGKGLRRKVTKSSINPMCNPETDKICTAPAYW